jgi:transposase-like protein
MYKKDVGSTGREIPQQTEGDTTDQSSLEGLICPNPGCSDAGQSGNIIKFGRSRQDIQRYRCKTCGTTFTATRSTIFYRRRVSHQSIMETLALLAEGVPISSGARAKRSRAESVRSWLNGAAHRGESPSAYVDVLGEHLVHLHLADTDRLPPGQGSLSFQPMFDKLDDVGYDGHYTAEIFGGHLNADEAALAARENLQAMLE